MFVGMVSFCVMIRKMAYTSVGFLFNPKAGRMLLHQRGSEVTINPDKWGFFGGGNEEEDKEDPFLTWQREVLEELGILLELGSIKPLCDYMGNDGNHRYVFYYEWPSLDDNFLLGEGIGYAWLTLGEARMLTDLTDAARKDLFFFKERIVKHGNERRC